MLYLCLSVFIPMWIPDFIYYVWSTNPQKQGDESRQGHRKMTMIMKWKTVFGGHGGDPESVMRRKREQ